MLQLGSNSFWLKQTQIAKRTTLAFTSGVLSLYCSLVLGQNAFPYAVFRRSSAKPLQRTHMVTNRAKDQQNKLRNPTHIMTSSSLKSTVTADIHYCRAGKAVTPGPGEDSGTLHCIACHIAEDRPPFTVKGSVGFSRKEKLWRIWGCKQLGKKKIGKLGLIWQILVEDCCVHFNHLRHNWGILCAYQLSLNLTKPASNKKTNALKPQGSHSPPPTAGVIKKKYSNDAWQNCAAISPRV